MANEKIDIVDSRLAKEQLDILFNELVKIEGQIVKTSKSVKALDSALSSIKSIADLTMRIKQLEAGQKKANSAMTEAEKLTKRRIELEKKIAVAFSDDAKAVAKLTKELASINAKHKEELKLKKETIKSTEKARKERIREANAIDSNKKALDRQRQAALKSASATKTQSKASKGLIATFKNLLKSMVAFIGVRMFIQTIKDTFNLIKVLDSLKFSMSKIADSFIVVADNMVFLRRITTSYGADLITTTERFIKFLAAAKQSGVTLKDTQNIFESVTKAAGVLGLKTDELRGVYLALEQMLSKGKVTTEELRRQLGERLPGAMGIMAAALGKTIPQLDEMLKKGEILSADALPKFAKALEVAYGIGSLTKVETLISAQTRLKNSWDFFVKAVAGGDSVITRSLNNILGGLDFILTKLSLIAQDFTLSLETATVDETILVRGKLLRNAKEIVEKREGITRKGLEKELELAKKAIEDGIALSDKEKNVLNENQRLKLNALIAFNDLVDKQQEDSAKKEFDNAKTSYLIQKKKFDDLISEKAKLDKIIKSGVTVNDNGDGTSTIKLLTKKDAEIAETSLDYTEKALENQVKIFSKIRAEFFEIRKLSQGSTEVINLEPDKTKNLREVADLEKEIQVGILKSQIELNNKEVENEQTTLDEKSRIAFENIQILNEIADLEKEIAIDAIVGKADIEKVALKKALDEKLISENEYTSQLIDINEERGQMVVLATQKSNAQIVENSEILSDSLSSIEKERFDKIISSIQNEANIKIIAAKKEFRESSKTAKDKEILEQKLKDIALESANAQILAELKILEARAASMAAQGQNIDSITEAINKLKGMLNEGYELGEIANAAEDLKDRMNDAMDQAIDITNRFFDNRIDRLEQDRDANEEFYDNLISLAEGNQDEQDRLEEEKERKDKALRERQNTTAKKQAAFNKSLAIAEIGFNLAKAISAHNAYAATLGPAGLAYAAVQIPISIALAAAQAASIIAQPVPKFKDGTDNAPSGLAIVGDGGKHEFIEDKYGNILQTPKTDTLVNLQGGETIHKDLESLSQSKGYNSDDIYKATVLTTLASEKKLSNIKIERILDNHLKGLKDDLKKGIRDGFSNVQMHNHTSIDFNHSIYKNNTL